MFVNLLLTLKLKKYRRVIYFVIFSCVFLGLILYRAEYLKLRYTFEVGGLLIPPELPSNCLVLNSSLTNRTARYDFFSRPRSHWSVANDFHVFSSFIIDDGSFTAVALGVGKGTEDCFKYKCHLWYTVGGVTFSVDGKLSCETFGESKSEDVSIEFTCQVDPASVRGVPYMLILLDGSQQRYLIPVRPVFKDVSKKNRYGLCVFPDHSGLQQEDIVEFLSFHQLIGFTDIIVYDNSLHYGIFNSLDDVFKHIDYFNTFTIIPWNFPIGDTSLGNDIVKRDCLYRTQGYVDFLTITNWNDYLIPFANKSVVPILDKFRKKETTVFNVDTKNCCVNVKNKRSSDKSWPMIFKKTTCLSSPINDSLALNLNSNFDKVGQIHIPPSEIYMNKYVFCDDLKKNVIVDTVPLKFLINLIGNRLLGIWRSGTLFSSSIMPAAHKQA